MTGVLLAAASGVGFGLFQSVNARAIRGAEDPYASTFVQIFVAAVGLTIVTAVTGELAQAGDASVRALADFAIAGALHFLAGWTMLNLSQQRIGAARTSPLLTTVPVFGVVVAAVTLGQYPSAVALGAIALMVLGAFVVATRGGSAQPRLADSLPGLACAFLWALSPIFILHGLEEFDSALAGLTVGLVASVAVYAPAYRVWRGSGAWRSLAGSALPLKFLAGVLVAVSTWWRWAALEDATVGAVLALGLLSVPVVLFLAPVIAGRHHEPVSVGLWAGAGLVVAGALTLVVA